jgi:hypothetical protein
MTNVAASLYASSAFADAGLRPYLSVTVVPEPASICLLLGLFIPCLRRRRQR